MGGDAFWWQPSEGSEDQTPEQLRDYGRFVAELATFGFKGVTLTIERDCGTCGKAGEIGSASVWGIDSLENGYLSDIVSELLSQALSAADINYVQPMAADQPTTTN